MGRIDATRIYDRDPEAQVFAELVRLERDRRVLVVSERSGMGKTDFLRKLRLESTRDHAVPVALVSLDDLKSRPDEFNLVEMIHQELASSGADFPTFQQLRSALRMKNAMTFAGRLKDVQGIVDLTGAVIESGAPRIAGVMYNINAETFVMPWDDEIETECKSMCVEAFLADLTVLVCEAPMALMFDSLDKAEERLLEWIISELVCRRALTEWRQRKLVIVLAGTRVESLVLGRLRDHEQVFVERLPEFAAWDAEQLGGFLEANDLGGLSAKEVQALALLLSTGQHSLMDVVLDARTWLKRRALEGGVVGG